MVGLAGYVWFGLPGLLIGGLVGCGAAWIWWSSTVPKWRRWALSRVLRPTACSGWLRRRALHGQEDGSSSGLNSGQRTDTSNEGLGVVGFQSEISIREIARGGHSNNRIAGSLSATR